MPNHDEAVVHRGKLWTIRATLSSVNADAGHSQIWAKMRPTFIGAGSTPAAEESPRGIEERGL